MASEEKVEIARKLLERLMKARGYSRLGLANKLGNHRGYVSQILSGRLELRLAHIVALLEAMDIEPLAYFELLFPRNGTPRADRGRIEEILLGDLSVPVAPPPPAPVAMPSMDELEALIERAVSRAMKEPPPQAPAPARKKTKSRRGE